MATQRIRNLSLLFCLAFACFLSAAYGIANQDDQAKADAYYKRYLEIVSKDRISNEEANTALNLATSAYHLFPNNYRYIYGLGFIHRVLGNWALAEKYYREASHQAPDTEKAEDARNWMDRCSVKNYLVSTGGFVYEIVFSLKSPGARNLDLVIGSTNPALPNARTEDGQRALIEKFRTIESDLNIVRQGPFFLIGPYSESRLVDHYNRGLADVYRIFKKMYFPDDKTDYLVVLISEKPRQLARIARELYPNYQISVEEPYMGFFCSSDSLIVATIGGGYGTLLHELMHALMAKNWPYSPSWLQEGMATLYERSAWASDRLVPLPNWRMDFLKNSALPPLAAFDMITSQGELAGKDLAEIRLFLLFLEKKSSLKRLLESQSSPTNKDKISITLAQFGDGYSEEDWQSFVQTTCSNYMAELASSPGAPSYLESKFIQHALNRLINANLKEDGIWGSATIEKVKEFQQKYGLDADGVVGIKTREKIDKEFSLQSLR